ncbi:hypothetical protein HL653_20225 [Sphingomonas sp. AP4-R1]|uniref:hypothetical protein n=1 Tax=Sphingomonas sp. AP4-R1 TaxID=2735134 RepID=UPI0014932C9C|nr:hypothetical protein [Sphingomonas sp. AP4-R1]QJU59769.1 hypothetical protein HL653_20225 [Sphingomonas sp. AP4-R1]
MRLEIGFIDDPSFNGWATTIDDTDVIALTTGVPALMICIWRALLSHPMVMPEIGSAADCTPRSFPASVSMPPEDYRLWQDGALECGVREALANHLAIGSVLHTFLHEFTHIWHGHTDFIAEEYGLQRYIERSSSSSGLTFQTIEWDADAGATHQILKLFLMPRVEIVRGLAKWHLDGPGMLDDIRQSITGAYMTAGIFDLFTSDYSEFDVPGCLDRGSHPPSVHRANSHGAMITTILNYRCGWSETDAIDMRDEAKLALITGLKAILPGCRLGVSTIEDFQSAMGKSRQLLAIYEGEWERIRPVLDAFKRGGNLPPSRPDTNPV